jgi:hypothetical protein
MVYRARGMRREGPRDLAVGRDVVLLVKRGV